MEIDSRDFLNSPPIKTVRFGGTVAETLAKHNRVRGDVILNARLMILSVFESNLPSFKGRLKGLRTPGTSVGRS